MRRHGLGFAFLASLGLAAAGCEGLFGVDFDGLGPKAIFATEAGADAGADAGDGSTCSADEKSCESTCTRLDEPATGCGAETCAPCPTAENGAPKCEAHQCVIACNEGYRRCRSGCCASLEKPIAAGATHTCATSSSGAVYCWGANKNGELGDGSKTARLTPVLAQGLEGGARELAVGIDFSVATTVKNGEVYTWGANALGTLGNGTAEGNRDTPMIIDDFSETAYVAAYGWHACAVSTSGFASCWGYNIAGVVGDGSTTPDVMSPSRVVQPEAFVSLSTNSSHACAVGVSGALYCWGSNTTGELGLTNVTAVDAPTLVPDIVQSSDLAAVACGNQHTCALTRAGAVRCWGANRVGQLGIGNTEVREHPVDTLPESAGARQIVAGDDYTCVVSASGAVQCWGRVYGTDAILDPPDDALRPSTVNLGPVAFLAAGPQHVCARMLDGKVRCWGSNRAGQLGDGTQTDRAIAIEVVFPN